MCWGSCNCLTPDMGWAIGQSKIQYHATSECSRVGKDVLEIMFKLVLPIFDDVYSGDLVFICLKWFYCTHMLIALLNRVWNRNWRRHLLHLDAVQFMWKTPESMACQGMNWLWLISIAWETCVWSVIWINVPPITKVSLMCWSNSHF